MVDARESRKVKVRVSVFGLNGLGPHKTLAELVVLLASTVAELGEELPDAGKNEEGLVLSDASM